MEYLVHDENGQPLWAGCGGFAATLTGLFGPAWVVTFLVVPLVGWARMRQRHIEAQMMAGGLVGAIVMTRELF